LGKLSNQKLKKLDNKFIIDFKGIVWNFEFIRHRLKPPKETVTRITEKPKPEISKKQLK
jgi:hypothetical protein